MTEGVEECLPHDRPSTRPERLLLERYREQFEILDWVAVGVTVQGPDGALMYANDAAARLMGFRASQEVLETPVRKVMERFEVLQEDGSPYPLERLPGRVALATGTEAPETVLRFRAAGSTEDRWSIVQARPVFDEDGAIRFVINVFREITAIKSAEVERNRLLDAERDARRTAERAVARVMRLQAVTGSLAEAITLDDVGHAGVSAGLGALDADAGSIAVHRPGADSLEIVHAVGYEAEVIEKYRIVALDAPLPLAEAIRKQDIVVLASEQERLERFPGTGAGGASYVSHAAVPMIIEGRAVGAFGLSFAEPREFTEEDRAFMLAVAQQCGLAVERARLYELERDARQEAEASRGRMAFLARASHELATSLDYVKTLANVARLMVPRMADWCGIDVVNEDGEVEQVAVAHIDPQKVELARELRKRYPPDLDNPGMGQVIKTGESLFLPDIPADLIEMTARDEEHLAIIKSLQMSGAMIVPLQARDRIFGAISFVAAESNRRFSEQDLLMAEEIGRRAGLAIDNARLFEETQTTERKLVQLVQNLEAVLWEAETSMRRFTFVSQRAQDILGFPLSDWLEKDYFWSQMIHEEDREPVLEYRRMSTQADEDHTVEYRIVTPEGREIWLRDIAHIVRDDHGETRGLRGLMVDITEQKMVERLLSESRERFAHVARTLQGSLLPPELPAIPGFELAARYRAAGQGNDVGGDFYDAFETEDGKWALVLGDVMGKGPRAAALTGLARHTLRAVTTRGRSPSNVLRRLNDAILKQDPSETQFATVALVYVWQEGAVGKAVIASGGHHLPLILRPDGSIEAIGRAGMVLGVFPDPDLTDTEITLQPGDTIVLFTDGVIEEGEGTRTFGEATLRSLVQGCAGQPPERIAEAIENAVVEFSLDEPRDDIAIMAVRLTGTAESTVAAASTAEEA